MNPVNIFPKADHPVAIAAHLSGISALCLAAYYFSAGDTATATGFLATALAAFVGQGGAQFARASRQADARSAQADAKTHALLDAEPPPVVPPAPIPDAPPPVDPGISKLAVAVAGLIVMVTTTVSSSALWKKWTAPPPPAPAVVKVDPTTVFKSATIIAPMVKMTTVSANMPSGTTWVSGSNFDWVVPPQPGIEYASNGLTLNIFAEQVGTYYFTFSWVDSNGMGKQHFTVTVPDPSGPDASKAKASAPAPSVPAPPVPKVSQAEPEQTKIVIVVAYDAAQKSPRLMEEKRVVTWLLAGQGKRDLVFVNSKGFEGPDGKGNLESSLQQFVDMAKGQYPMVFWVAGNRVEWQGSPEAFVQRLM